MESTIEAKAGDMLAVGTSRFALLSIVPPMKTAGIAGWVELNSAPSN